MFKKLFKNKYKNLSKFFKYYKHHNNLIKKLLLVMSLASSLGMALPYFCSKRIIGITDISFKEVLMTSIAIILIITFHHVFWYLWEKLASALTNRVAMDIRNDLINKIINTKYSDIKQHTCGYYLERINDDTLEVSSFLSNVLGTLVDTMTNFGFLVLIYILNYKCGLLFTVGIIILYLVDLLKIKKDLKYTGKLKILNESFNSKVNENIRGIKDIKGLGIKDGIINVTSDINKSIAKEQINKDKRFALLSRVKTYTQYIIETLIIIYSVGILIPKGEISTAILLMIINYTGFMYDLVGYIANMKDCFEKSEFKARRLLEILDNKNVDEFGNYNKKNTSYNVKVKNLTYCYDDNKYVKVLNNISFEIKENTANIFIGHSGSGKSTLFGLLTKILNTKNDTIFIGNKDINDISEEIFRKSVCIITQEPFLINDTIINNLRIVKPNATIEELKKACEIANIYDEIEKFDKKFETLIVENGNNLSGGQKQRLAIARAILKDTPILLFDEPTSALDYKNQKLFFETINNLKRKKTILIIAHKFDNLDLFDHIFELNDGILLCNK